MQTNKVILLVMYKQIGESLESRSNFTFCTTEFFDKSEIGPVPTLSRPWLLLLIMMTDSDPSTLGLDNASAPPNLSQSPTSYGSSHDEEVRKIGTRKAPWMCDVHVWFQATSSSTSTSGYGTEPIAAGIGRSDTLENIDEPKDRIKTSAVHGNGTGHANGSVHPICDNQASYEAVEIGSESARLVHCRFIFVGCKWQSYFNS